MEKDIGERIVKEGERIGRIVKTLLSYARDGREEKKPTRVPAILEESIILIQAQIRKEGIDLKIDLPDDLPEVDANFQQIQQGFINIINNARYALNEKYPGRNKNKRFEITGEKITINNRPHVRIVFYDQGVGISAHELSMLTKPFFSTKPFGKGTGLGLNITQRIITDHGGQLSFESAKGEFTRVIIDLPAIEAVKGWKMSDARILVIDDEESIRFTFERFLTAEGYMVATAESCSEALARINETSFDVVFADIILGDGTGIDILREIKARGLSCPVIMITGDPGVETAADSIRLGAFDYIPKPVNQESLLHATRTALKYKAVNEEKEKYRTNLEAIFRSVRDAIITVDKESVVIELNEAAMTMCGYSRTTSENPLALCPWCAAEDLWRFLRKRSRVESLSGRPYRVPTCKRQ